MDPNYNNQNQQNQEQPTPPPQFNQSPQFNQPPQFNQAPYQQSPNPYQPPEQKGMAIASLVLGILSVVCCGWLLGLLGIIFSVQGKKKAPSMKGMCTAGMVLSIIGLVFGLIFTIRYATGSITLDSLYWNLYY